MDWLVGVYRGGQDIFHFFSFFDHLSSCMVRIQSSSQKSFKKKEKFGSFFEDLIQSKQQMFEQKENFFSLAIQTCVIVIDQH